MTIAWHDEARRLRAEGKSVSAIARELGKAPGSVSYVFCDREKEQERGRDRDRKRAVRKDAGGRHHGYERSYVKPHKPRIIKKLPGDPREIALRFAANEIDRSELSRQLWGGA